VHCLNAKNIRIFIYSLGVFIGSSLVQANASEVFLGMQIQGLSPSISSALGLETSEGVLVRDIAFPSPSSRSKMKRGDLIIELDGKPMKNVDEVVKYIKTLDIDGRTNATVIRQGKRMYVEVPVGATPDAWKVKRNSFATIPAFGVTFASVTDKVRKRFKLGWRTRGVVVSLVDEEKTSGFDIHVGDVIVQINQRPVSKPSDIVNYLQEAQKQKKEAFLLLVESFQGFRYVLLPVPH